MFGMRDLRRRVAALEAKNAKAEQIADCARGHHKWEVCEHGGISDIHVRCVHCFHHPKNTEK